MFGVGLDVGHGLVQLESHGLIGQLVGFHTVPGLSVGCEHLGLNPLHY